MDAVPEHVGLVFIITALVTLAFIIFGIYSVELKVKYSRSFIVLIGILLWLLSLALIAKSGFLSDFESFPPRFLLVILPANFVIIILLILKKTRAFLLQIPITTLTYLHIIRVPIEIVLWWLSLSGIISDFLTFEGINHDIISGITAPFVAIFLVNRNRRIGAIIWNVIALCLLVNIVGHAILSTPYPFQQFSLDLPLTAVFYFPYIWLPGFIVPAVLFAHLVSLAQLFNQASE